MSAAGEHGSRLADSPLDVAAQPVSFGPGLYVVTLSATATAQTGGLPLPCVRLDPLPPTDAAPGTAHVACLNDGNWLTGNGRAAFLRVTGGQAALMLTTYNPSGAAQPPQVRIRLVPDDAAATTAVGQGARSGPLAAAEGSPIVSLVAHCSGEASKVAGAGEWVEAAGPDGFIEAFRVEATAGVPLALEYQAIMGVDWVSPWASSPNLCGSIGLGLAIFGVRMRLAGPQADGFALMLWGRSGSREVGPVTTGELAFGLGQPLTALKLQLRPVQPAEPRSRPRRMPRPRTMPPDPDRPA